MFGMETETAELSESSGKFVGRPGQFSPSENVAISQGKPELPSADFRVRETALVAVLQNILQGTWIQAHGADWTVGQRMIMVMTWTKEILRERGGGRESHRYTSLCVYTYMGMHMSARVHVLVCACRGQRLVSGVFLHHSPLEVLRQCHSVILKLTDLARLSCQQVPQISCLHLPHAGRTGLCLSALLSSEFWA